MLCIIVNLQETNPELVMNVLVRGNKEELLWRLFEKSFCNTASQLATFQHFLEWPATTAFIRMYGKFTVLLGYITFNSRNQTAFCRISLPFRSRNSKSCN